MVRENCTTMINSKNLLTAFAVFACVVVCLAGKKPLKSDDECDVCVNVINKFDKHSPNIREKSTSEIETAFKKFCKTLTDKEDRFCYYIGGSETSATYILGKLAQPFKNHLPPLKICDKLRDADPQICELKYEKQIDLTEVDFKKLKVKDLKKILSDWGEDKACKGCSEKSDFVRAVKNLMPKYAPEAAKKLSDEL